MARSEITQRRGKTSKLYKNDDGSYTVEAGGPIAHHLKNGQWVETDRNWTDVTDKYGVGEYPFDIYWTKQTRTLTIDFRNGDVITFSPRNSKNPTGLSRGGSMLTVTDLWRGIDITLTLLPDGLSMSFKRTASNITNPSFNITGPVATYHSPCIYDDGTTPTEVPQTLTDTILTYDMSGIPVGGVVS